MKKVLLLGAGMVAQPFTDYILDQNIGLTIATRTKEKADNLLKGRKHGQSFSWTADDLEMLDKMVSEHDLVVSLLPYTFHSTVAKLCIKHKKNMVTTSYVSAEMKSLANEAKEAGIIILNEMGVDPGFDHMTAMRIIDKVHDEGGKVKQFYSLCGALPAPEEANNPFRYKFSWSPRGVILAGNNDAKFLKNGKIIEIPAENLFKNLMKIDFPELGQMEVYPNRDSLVYIPLYGLHETETMYRGTFRYPNWCETMDAIKTLGMISNERKNFEGKSCGDVVAENIGVYPANVKEKVAEKLNLTLNSPPIIAMEWLGLFSKERIQLKEASTFDLTADLMLKKMMLPEGARDMVIMQHWFLVEKSDGKKEVVKSYLLDFATEKNTSVARTVALPAAIAAKLILQEQIKDAGVLIPTSKNIYKPVLAELETMGIKMHEEWGLPESDKLG
ncbi:MAG: saccharopine dehydrogenase NADP-binding domain-containing protein [Prolixibacteraceae bacterium]|nr:saccharopine dehydrogenase NADP-binding domain-containing protein [Prolixibacteraceae bacterium]